MMRRFWRVVAVWAFLLAFACPAMAQEPVSSTGVAESRSGDELAQAKKRKKRKVRRKKTKKRSKKTPPPEEKEAEKVPAVEPAAEAPEAQPPPDPVEPEPPPAPVAEASAEEEEAVNFDEEEEASDREASQIQQSAGGHPGGGGGGTGMGFKIFADLLMEHRGGRDGFDFTMHHSHVILQVSLDSDLRFMIHISDDPLFYELHYNITPYFSVRAGKLLVPFGTNEFHHIIGGRVDELSNFLPEIWADYGVGIHHDAFDGEWFALAYDLYAVNGFQGVDRPVFGTGVATDNNAAKGIGTRLKMDFFGNVGLTGSLYWNIWDPDDSRNMVFYSVGLELRPGLIDLPVLNRIGLRGEWARGEVQLADGNFQRGLLKHAFARTGFYGELKARILEKLSFRFRTGLINPDNTVSDEGDILVFEPAVLIGNGKLSFLIAYQMTLTADGEYSAENPPDVGFAKFFLQY